MSTKYKRINERRQNDVKRNISYTFITEKFLSTEIIIMLSINNKYNLLMRLYFLLSSGLSPSLISLIRQRNVEQKDGGNGKFIESKL